MKTPMLLAALLLMPCAPAAFANTVSELPTPCMMMPVLTSGIHGSDAYVRFRYVLESLEFAQASISSLDGVDKPDDSQTIATQLATMLTAMDDAKDNLRCASEVMKMFPANDEHDKTLKSAFITAYGMETKAVSDSIIRVKDTMSHTAKHSDTELKTLDQAEFLSNRTRMEDRAATELMEATAYAFALAVYTDDPNATTTEFLKMNAKEYADISQRVAELSKKEKSAFTDCANFLIEPLAQHKPR